MTEFILGAVAGAVGGILVKGTVGGNKSEGEISRLQRESDSLSDELERMKKRNREAEGRIEDLMAENQRLFRKNKEHDDLHDDLEDERDMLKGEVKNLQASNEALARELREYKVANETLQNEINILRKK